jgi:hypothetical protein
MGHAPSKIPRISAIFKDCAPFLATSHGGGALVALVVKVVGGAEVPGSNPRASPPIHIYACARFVIYGLYVKVFGRDFLYIYMHI